MSNALSLAILLAGLLVACAMVGFALLAPAGGGAVKRRLTAVRARHSDSANVQVEAQLRKVIASRKPKVRSAEDSKSRLDMLRLRLYRSGKKWTVQQYVLASLGLAVVLTLLLYVRTGSLLLSGLIGIAAGAFLPHLVLGWIISGRINKFNMHFADAIELLVRGLRSGLPVTETLGVVAAEIPGPVGEEFKLVTERVRIGRAMDEALQESAERLGTPEFKFFCITLAIQRETGGNLAETLTNLANVLRGRAQMKLKIRAMSSESKASAYIVGALPFLVFGMIYWINPKYLGGFFVDERLIVVGLGGLCWMGIGAFIMSRMVSFEI